jgi:hypothetical protein
MLTSHRQFSMGWPGRTLNLVLLNLLLAFVPGTAPAVFAQRVAPMTAAEIRALTRDAQSAARGDKDELILGLDARARARWGDFESFPISIVKREDLRVVLSSPYMTYRRTLAEYLRMARPVADVPWIGAIVIVIEPSRIDAPDITRVAVERAGRAIGPIENLLRPMKFSNGSGGEATIHAGEVRFPLEAFAPGAPVTITATPAVGDPFLAMLNDAQLSTLK